MKIGYARVSTNDQNPELQLAALKKAGCRTIYADKATGAHTKRPELAKCLTVLKKGDMLVVWKLDRLGRSLRDLITLLDELKGRGVAFKSLTGAQVAHARKLVAQGERPVEVAKVLGVSRRTVYRALEP